MVTVEYIPCLAMSKILRLVSELTTGAFAFAGKNLMDCIF